MKITRYHLHRVHFHWTLPIGDSQVRFDDLWMTVLELETDSGSVGLGVEGQQGRPTPTLDNLNSQWEYGPWPSLQGADPRCLALALSRPRGGNVGAGAFGGAVEMAIWDLLAKSMELPLYRLLGSTEPKVRAYGSTLDFHLTDDQFRAKLQRFQQKGFRAVKIKVGHPDVAWDLHRLGIVHEVLGRNIDLMVDANEAWTPKETLYRAHRYRDSGFDIYWIEDPITRDDYDGYRRLCAELPFTRINTGEYVGFSGKRQLLQTGGVDVMNVHAHFGANRALAQLAGEYGIPLALGNTSFEIGVHLAASLPECLYMEFSDLGWNELAREPIRFEGGYAIAPDRPGHGIELNRTVLERLSEPG